MSLAISRDLLDDLDRSEKMFQDRMGKIFEKYNHAFEEDIVVNIVNFTYESANGPVPFDFKANTKYKKKTPKKNLQDSIVKDETWWGEPCNQKLPGKKAKETHSISNKTFLLEDSSDDSLEDYLNTSCLLQKKPVVQRSGDICEKTFIYGGKCESIGFDQTQLSQCKRNVSSSINHSPMVKSVRSLDGQGQSLIPYSDSRNSIKTFHVSSVEEDSISVQMRSFISRHNKDCSFDDTQTVYEPNDSSFLHPRAMLHFDIGDKNLAYLYPDMVECIRRLWELPWKKRAADNIVQYYKRQMWIAQKKKLMKQKKMLRPAKGSMQYHTLCEYKSYNGGYSKPTPKTDNTKAIIQYKTNPFSNITKVDGVNYFSSKNIKPLSITADALPKQSSFTAFPVLQNTVKTVYSMNPKTTALDSSFTTHMGIQEFDSSYVGQTNNRFSDTFTLTKVNIIKTPQKCSTSMFHVSPVQEYVKQLSRIASSLQERKSSLSSGFHSPGKQNAISKCKMDLKFSDIRSPKKQNKYILDTTCTLDSKHSSSALTKSSLKSFWSMKNGSMCLDKTINYQNNVKIDEGNSLRQELAKLKHFAQPHARSNSFSSFPVVHKGESDNIFDRVYRKETVASQRYSSSIPKVQSSDMFCSLVNSPGSLRAKRRASRDLPSAVFKRQKSFDETFIQSASSMHYSMKTSFLSLQGTRDSHSEPYLVSK